MSAQTPRLTLSLVELYLLPLIAMLVFPAEQTGM
jgi:hypothetical protein